MKKINSGYISDILEYIGYVEKFISQDVSDSDSLSTKRLSLQ
ncbi:hypothetical protein [Aequorivita ciconiae]|nr:hypothetical protein [Aequorivita sp. H23M31]